MSIVQIAIECSLIRKRLTRRQRLVRSERAAGRNGGRAARTHGTRQRLATLARQHVRLEALCQLPVAALDRECGREDANAAAALAVQPALVRSHLKVNVDEVAYLEAELVFATRVELVLGSELARVQCS